MTIELRTALAAYVVVAVLLVTPSEVEAQQTLAAARDLYASAAYSDALAMLNNLSAREPARDDRQLIELYRTLCLVALGRKDEADRAVETMIARDPFYRPPTDDLPPRMRSAFSAARKRLLPTIVQHKYLEAKGAFDRRDFARAASGFTQVLQALSDPDLAPVTSQPPLADLRILAEGFHDLSEKAVASPPLPSAAASRTAALASRIYGVEDREVAPPIVIRQQIPPMRAKIANAGNGVLEVIIDAAGAVESARMSVPLHGPYDQQVLAATKSWRYEPAKVDGVPVKFRKLVKVSLVPTPPGR